MTNKVFLIFSIQGWSDMWVSKHWIASSLTKEGKVYFIEPFSGIFLPGRNARICDFLSGPRIRKEGDVNVVSISCLPGYYRGPGWYRALSRLLMAKQFKRIEEKIIGTEANILTFDCRIEPIIRKFKSIRKTIYYAIDIIKPKDNDPWWPENSIVHFSDHVLTTSKRHQDRLIKYFGRRDIKVLPHGVNYEAALLKEIDRPNDLPTSTPIIGYTGTIHDQYVDFEIIREVALANPEWSFVFIGPINKNPLSIGASDKIKVIQHLPNVHFLGKKAYRELPRYIKFFDVCLMPYAPDVDNEPFKTLNYFAQGKPVVSRDVPGVSEYRKLIYTFNKPSEVNEKINLALSEPKSHPLRQERIQYARERDFNIISNQLIRVFNE